MRSRAPRRPPFVRHAWLTAMEESGSAQQDTGWAPHHLTLWRGETLVGRLARLPQVPQHGRVHLRLRLGQRRPAHRRGVLPQARHRRAAVPRHRAALPGGRRARTSARLRRALLAGRHRERPRARAAPPCTCSTPPRTRRTPGGAGAGAAHDLQFHWKNPGYRSYDDYLARFELQAPPPAQARARRRREARASPCEPCAARSWAPSTPERAHALLRGHLRAPLLGPGAAHPGLLRTASSAPCPTPWRWWRRRDGKVIAGRLQPAQTPERLYGRYWGCFEEHPFLHFNVCLYHSVDECIRAGRKVFEPGAGGEHKVSRGFEPTAVHSAHLIFDPQLDRAIRDFLRRERAHLAPAVEEAERLAGLKPWPLAG